MGFDRLNSSRAAAAGAESLSRGNPLADYPFEAATKGKDSFFQPVSGLPPMCGRCEPAAGFSLPG